MFDTVAHSQTISHSLDVDLLIKNGCKPIFSKYTGDLYRLVLNDEKDSKEPRITISRTPKALWIIRSEVSVANWLFESSLRLPDESDVETYCEWLSQRVGTKTGTKFDARQTRIARVDFTRDFQIGESKVLTVLSKLRHLQLEKYNTRPVNNTTIYLVNKGKKLSKRYKLYSKSHEIALHNGTDAEYEKARGILRLEVEHRTNRAVTNLAKSLKYPNHNAQYILTRYTSDAVINKAMKILNLEAHLENELSAVENLFTHYNEIMAKRLILHLVFKSQYGSQYYELPFISTSAQAVKKYDAMCAKVGTLSLE